MMFPVTDSSQTVIDCIINDADRNGVERVMYNKVVSIKLVKDSGWYYLKLIMYRIGNAGAQVPQLCAPHVPQLLPQRFEFHHGRIERRRVKLRLVLVVRVLEDFGIDAVDHGVMGSGAGGEVIQGFGEREIGHFGRSGRHAERQARGYGLGWRCEG